ncbi:hypothetical protein [Chondromyces apiculatus]|uniref:PEGA domain-containing protein n=1 Tax=Chondromyces apiculatus DSM 436 TaxID=1192034 RepID=A0A017SXU2_9BACT|nr:hypothetical protein [Chondromyces apiculatus]EYF01793.1 Hypothetical protein CAP_7746 [Chondromyces apiculatus DSM 436]
MRTTPTTLRRHRGWTLLLAVAVTVLSASAQAAEPTAEDRERARALLLEGREKLKAGDGEVAVRYFQAAHAIMGVPTTGLDLAKGLVALGRLMEARAVALGVTKIPPTPDETMAFTRARRAAAELAEELANQIPALVITVKQPAGVQVQVLVDGKAVPAEALGLPWKVNPGKHLLVVAARGFQAEPRQVTVKVAESLTVELSLSPETGAARALPEAPRRVGGARMSPSGESSASPPSRGEVTAGPGGAGPEVPGWVWIPGGAGLLALGAGLVFAINHAAVRGTVSEDCPANLCDWNRYDDAKATALEAQWNRSLGLALGFGAAGLLGVGSALYGIVTAEPARPSDAEERKSRRDLGVVPWAGDKGAGAALVGHF